MVAEAVVTGGDSAERTLAWLTSLDATHAARQELLAAGVPETTANSLYPVTFEAIVPGLINHLQAGGQGLLRVTSDSAMTEFPAVIFEALEALPLPGPLTPASYLARWKAEGLAGKWFQPLVEAVVPRLGSYTPEAYQSAALVKILSSVTANAHHAAPLVEILWYTWHLTVEPVDLPADHRRAVRQVLGWYGEQLFGLGSA